MQQLLTKGIGHTEFNKTEFGDIPKEWSVISSNKVFNVITDYVANGSFADLAKNVEYKEYEEYAILVRLTDYKNNYKGPFIYVDKNAYDFLGKSKLEENDIIISNVGAYAGYVFRAPSIKKPITLGPNAILVRSNENRDFLYYWLSSDIGQKKIREIISTTAQPKFNKTDFKKIKLPIPSLDEQEKIALILSSIDKKIEQDKYKKEKLEEVKKGLMQNLLTGKLRVI
nr:restriction endonuclease subunit S [Clostridium perfringens]